MYTTIRPKLTIALPIPSTPNIDLTTSTPILTQMASSQMITPLSLTDIKTIPVTNSEALDQLSTAITERYFLEAKGLFVDPNDQNYSKGSTHHYGLMALLLNNDIENIQKAITRIDLSTQKNSNHLYPWLIRSDGVPIDYNSATDSDLGIIEFLIQCYYQYQKSSPEMAIKARDMAITMTNNVWMISVKNNKLVPGDGWGFKGEFVWNHSYSMYGILVQMKWFENDLNKNEIAGIKPGHDYAALINHLAHLLKYNEAGKLNPGFNVGRAHDFTLGNGNEYNQKDPLALDNARIYVHAAKLIQLSSLPEYQESFGESLNPAIAILREFCQNYIDTVLAKMDGSTEKEKALDAVTKVADMDINGQFTNFGGLMLYPNFKIEFLRNPVIWSGYLAALSVAKPEFSDDIEQALLDQYLKTDSAGLRYVGFSEFETKLIFNQTFFFYTLLNLHTDPILPAKKTTSSIPTPFKPSQ